MKCLGYIKTAFSSVFGKVSLLLHPNAYAVGADYGFSLKCMHTYLRMGTLQKPRRTMAGFKGGV